MDFNNEKEIKGHIDNQGIWRGDNYIVVSIFYCNYQAGDRVLIETAKGIEEEVLTEANFLCDCGFNTKNILGLVFEIDGRNNKPNKTTEESGRRARVCTRSAA